MSNLNFEENASVPCKSQHKWSGKVPTIEDESAVPNESVCDCGKFVVRYEGCNCGGTRQAKYYENSNYIPNN